MKKIIKKIKDKIKPRIVAKEPKKKVKANIESIEDKAKRLSKAGLTIREIAIMIDISRYKTSQLVKRWNSCQTKMR